MCEHMLCWKVFDNVVELPTDVILLVKQFMHSQNLCQQPMLWAPGDRLSRLSDTQPRTCRQLRPLSKETAREFRKTASRVAKYPWLLVNAAKFLTDLVDRWERGETFVTDLPSINFYNSGSRNYIVPEIASTFDAEWYQFAPKTPKTVRVERLLKQPEAKRRRLTLKTKDVARVARVGGPPEGIDLTAVPALGCPKCRRSAKGCRQCRQRRQDALARLGLSEETLQQALASGAVPELDGGHDQHPDGAPAELAAGAGFPGPDEAAGPGPDEVGPNTSDEEVS